MSVVVDASVLVSALIDTGPEGTWSMEQMESYPVAAPHLITVEAAHALRRNQARGRISHDMVALAYSELTTLPLSLYPFRPFADRVRELWHTVTPYEAWYVALAEALETPMVTLDKRLANASGPTCRFRTPASD